MEEIHKLRVQISKLAHANFPDSAAEFVPKVQPPNENQAFLVLLPHYELPCSFVKCLVKNTAAIAHSWVN